MKWSWNIGTFAGVKVHMHATFLLLVGWIALTHWMQYESLLPTLLGIGFILTLFACVVLHEYGHALAARKFGIATRDITLLPIGGVARMERVPDKPNQELWVALAGPAVNVVIAALLAAYLLLTGHFQPIQQIGLTYGLLLERVMFANLFVVGFNMIPAFPMDGGRVLRALMAKRMEHARATRFAAGLGQGLAFVFGFVGLFTDPFLVFIAFLVWIGAAQEAALVETESLLRSVSVREAMIPEFQTLSPDDELAKAVKLVLGGWQRDFPVVEQGCVMGMLLRADMIANLSAGDIHSTVEHTMRRDFPVASPTEPVQSVFVRLHEANAATLPIVEEGRLVGVIALEDMTEYMMTHAQANAKKKSNGRIERESFKFRGLALPAEQQRGHR